MIGRLRGTLASRAAGRIIVDVHGVGYVVSVPMSTFLALPPEGSEVELLVNTQVREDAISLYGFRDEAEQQVFESLLTVSGVGPRTALAALSALGPGELASAIREGDSKRISAVPGIGKKTAERVIVDLRDRLGAVSPRPGAGAGEGASSDVVSALSHLGYPERQASRVVGEILDLPAGRRPEGFDATLREALKRLARSS